MIIADGLTCRYCSSFGDAKSLLDFLTDVQVISAELRVIFVTSSITSFAHISCTDPIMCIGLLGNYADCTLLGVIVNWLIASSSTISAKRDVVSNARQ